MKVKILGFRLSLAKNISVGEFYQQLEAVEEKEISINGRTHILLTDIVNDYICGVFLTYKTNKKSLATQKDKNGDLIVNKATLKPGEHGTEVSVFCINPSTLKGLFYNYNGAASPTGIQKFFRDQHNAVKRLKIDDYKNQITDFRTKNIDGASKKARKMFEGDFHLRILVTPSDLEGIIPRYKEIHQVILRAEDALANAGVFSPIEPMTKKAHLQVDLYKENPTKEVGRLIRKIFSPYASWKKDRVLRVVGLSHSGDALELAVGDNQDHFGVIDYDDYVELLPLLRWKEYTECEALLKLIAQCDGMSEVFGITNGADWKITSAKDLNRKASQGGLRVV